MTAGPSSRLDIEDALVGVASLYFQESMRNGYALLTARDSTGKLVQGRISLEKMRELRSIAERWEELLLERQAPQPPAEQPQPPAQHKRQPHAGGECPVDRTAAVVVWFRDGTFASGLGRTFVWSHRPGMPDDGDIVSYMLI